MDAFRMVRPTADYSFYFRLLLNSAPLLLADTIALLGALLLGGLIRLVWRGDFMVADVSALLIPSWWIGAIILRLTPGWGISAVETIRRMVLLTLSVMA
ncbi:MAG: hypothetical protein NTY53_16220, partial [Kiritimatiellaeota bacterium]|nr:hypothetical protein [Kiritimatiellota bacterium]